MKGLLVYQCAIIIVLMMYNVVSDAFGRCACCVPLPSEVYDFVLYTCTHTFISHPSLYTIPPRYWAYSGSCFSFTHYSPRRGERLRWLGFRKTAAVTGQDAKQVDDSQLSGTIYPRVLVIMSHDAFCVAQMVSLEWVTETTV